MSDNAALGGDSEARRWILAGVFVTALATLVAELALTRIFSVVLYFHFAFMAISVALLGLGSGGLLAYFLAGWLERGGVWPQLGLVAAINGILTASALDLILHQRIPLTLSLQTVASLAIVYFCALLPFFGSGMVLAAVFARTAHLAGTVYFADLAGAGLGCVLLIPLLEQLGGPNTVLVAAGLWGLSAVCWMGAAAARQGAGARRWAGWLLLPLAFVIAIGINVRVRGLDVRFAKGRSLQKEIFARWNSFSRVSLVGTDPKERWIQIDNDAQTQVADAPPEDHAKWAQQMRDFSSGIVYRLRPGGRVLIMGPGGGVDIARAISAGSRDVTGVEINPIIVNDIMRGMMRQTSFALYDRPEVRIFIEDARSFIRRSSERYDVILATLVDTWASTAAGAFALSENNLYTVEAFQEYLRHLTPDGMLAIARWEFETPREALRVLSLALEALNREGAQGLAGHLAVVADDQLTSQGTLTTVLIRRTPFPEQEVRTLEQAVATGAKTMQLLAAPGLVRDNAFSRLLNSPDREAFYASYPFDIRPVDDNRPFFFFTMKTADVLSEYTRKPIDLKINLAVGLLVAVLLLSGVAVVAFLLVPAWLTRRLPAQAGARWWLLYFTCLGLAYILVEIAFMQKFVLFLGHPTYGLSVAVLALLLSSALGSRYSQRWPEEWLVSRVGRWLGILAAVLLALALVVVPLATRFVWLPLWQRILLATALLALPGFMMGVPFPSGLRLVRLSYPAALEWAWAMNAAASVLGSAVAVFISIHLGIWQTTATGALCYGAAAALLYLSATPRR